MVEPSTFATEEFLKKIGRNSGVKTDKEGNKYFIETGTGRHIEIRFGIPVTLTSLKGKITHRLVGSFRTLNGAYAYLIDNVAQGMLREAKHTLCHYYGQPVGNLNAGPTAEQILDDPTIDDAAIADLLELPGVMIAADHKARKRKASGDAAKAKPKKAPKAKAAKIVVPKGYSLVGSSKNPEKALKVLATSVDVVSAQERIRKRGAGISSVMFEGYTVFFTQDIANPKARANGWGELGITGEFLVRATRNVTLRYTAPQK